MPSAPKASSALRDRWTGCPSAIAAARMNGEEFATERDGGARHGPMAMVPDEARAVPPGQASRSAAAADRPRASRAFLSSSLRAQAKQSSDWIVASPSAPRNDGVFLTADPSFG